MPIEFRSEPGLLAELINTAAGVPGSIPVRLASGSTGTVASGLVRAYKWTPVTAATLTIEPGEDPAVTASSGLAVSELIAVSEDGLAGFNSCDGHMEVVLVGNPLAIDAYGNPIAATRTSAVTVTATNAADATVVSGALAVTAADQASILTSSTIISGTDWIRKIAVTGVTANGCTLYILILARVNP